MSDDSRPAWQSQTIDSSVASRDVADVVFTFSAVDTWADAVRRGMFMPADRLVDFMLTDPRVGRLLVANPYRSRPIRMARRFLGQRDTPFPTVSGNRELFQPMRLLRDIPTQLEKIVSLTFAYDARLRKAAARMGLERPAMITCNPFVAGFSALEWADSVTYYAFDDWAAYPPHQMWQGAYEAAYKCVAERGRRVCAVSQAIIDRVRPTGEWVVVPNGVTPSEWAPPWQVPPWFLTLPAPRMLYIGTIDSRLDTDALVATAQRFPQGSVVLVGAVTDPAAIEPLRNISNLHIEEQGADDRRKHRPPVGRKELAGMVHEADVCLLPHRSTALTKAMSPLKLYEYLAAGRPVAASDLPPVRSVDNRIVIAGSTDDFANAVSRAYEVGAMTEEERYSFIARNAWGSRHQAILDLALHR